MTLYACRSSSHKTRYASFVGTLKDKKAFARPRGGAYNMDNFFRPFGAPPSYIGLPQRFCEAKDLWEEREGGKRNEEMI